MNRKVTFPFVSLSEKLPRLITVSTGRMAKCYSPSAGWELATATGAARISQDMSLRVAGVRTVTRTERALPL